MPILKRKMHAAYREGDILVETLNHVASDVAGGKSVRAVAKAYVIDRMTLKHFIIRKEQALERLATVLCR